ncbi:hypothetical protein KKB99_04500 [bacterium]|nr:hypothetical protein [bacterium]MBU1025255.1 hypothetical protein [bacterium]
MPIEPIENPYRVLKFQETRRSRRVQPRDPEEKAKYAQEDALKKEEKEETEASTTDEETTLIETEDESPQSEPNKKKLDIRI